MSDRQITQAAPWSDDLEDLVQHLRFKPGWTYTLHESYTRDHVDPNDDSSPPLAWGTTFDILTWGFNTYHLPDRPEWRDRDGHDGYWTSKKCRDCGQEWPCDNYRYENDPKQPAQPYRVHHYFEVPAATYNRQSWVHWLFKCCLRVDEHEAMEHFGFEYEYPNKIGIETFGTRKEVERPYRPIHAPGWDPYMIVVVEHDDTAHRTSFRGVLKDA